MAGSGAGWRAAAFRGVLGLAALAALGCPQAAFADQILQIYGETLTSYKAGASEGQGIRPQHLHRGVNIDGSARAAATFPWAFAGNPFEGGAGGARLGDVSLATGGYSPTEIDIALPAQVPWVIGRSYSGVQVNGSSHHDSNGPQGFNWFQMSQPEIAFYDDNDNSKDVVYVVYGADRYLEFQRAGSSSTVFKGKNGAAGVVVYVSGTPDTYVYYDQHGTATHFFGDDTSGGHADWQIWKVVDAAGEAAYVGHETDEATAVSSGYNDGTTGPRPSSTPSTRRGGGSATSTMTSTGTTA